jgi:CHAT domain-containing protein
MPDTTPCTTLLLRLRPADDQAPEVHPVEVTLDGAGTFSALVSLDPGAFKDLESSPWEYGRKLGQAVFTDPGLQRALAYARGRSECVSLSLQLDAPDLQDLLWERLILVSGGEELPFAASGTVSLSRRIPSETQALPPRQGPFRLLLMISSPDELAKVPDNSPMKSLDYAVEVGGLRSAWDPLVQRGLMRVSILGRLPESLAADLNQAGYRVHAKAATLDTLADLLSSSDSLHLISHGAFKNDRASLLLETPEGRAASTSEDDFLAKFAERSLRLIFLQACQSATRQPGVPNVLSGLAPKLAGRAAGVIAMQDFVRVDDARRFAQEFYDTLLSTGFADRAANAGRRTLYRPDSRSWAIPALYLAPKADPLWEPDAVLRAVQDLADQLNKKPDLKAPFPIEVIRQWPDISSKMETSPPGPRVRVLEAVSGTLFPDKGKRSPIVVVAGNYGRAKTAQLYMLYAYYANQISRADGTLPFFARMSEIEPSDDAPEDIIARAISKTYKSCGIDLPVALLAPRLQQPFLLCLDGDQEADGRQRNAAFDALKQITGKLPQAVAAVTLDEQVIDQLPALRPTDPETDIPTFLVQLLSPTTVAQYLTGFGDRFQPLLTSIQAANLFDLAGVPWLLANLIRQSNRGALSRSGVIARVVNGNLAASTLTGGIRRLVEELLGRIAWELQTRQKIQLDAPRLYEILDQVRGRREVPLDQLKAYALETKILAPSDDDGVRFSYPGFQSYWCAQYLLRAGRDFSGRLDDITATLGRRSRVRLWEDTLVLLAGMMDSADPLIRRIVAGSSMSYGEHAFLAARCIHEAELAKGSRHGVQADVIAQVLDSLVWRSTPMKEWSATVRIRATESLALLKHPSSVPHLVSLAVERVRPTFNGQPTFELSGLRHAALQVLLTMQAEAEAHVRSQAAGRIPTPEVQALAALIEAWRKGDSKALRELYETTSVEGVPAVVVFALGTIGGDENRAYLAEQIVNPDAAEDTVWSIADSLLLFDPETVTRDAVTRMRKVPGLHVQAAYMIGRLRVAAPGSEEQAFLVECLKSSDVLTRGVALKALAQLGHGDYRELCELIAKDAWKEVAKSKVLAVPSKAADRMQLRVCALESLRVIGTGSSLVALREARNWRPEGGASDRDATNLTQLSYAVSEDIYWRITGGLEGDFFEAAEQDKRS